MYDDLKGGAELEVDSPLSRMDPKVRMKVIPGKVSDSGVVNCSLTLFGAQMGILSVSPDGQTHFQEIK